MSERRRLRVAAAALPADPSLVPKDGKAALPADEELEQVLAPLFEQSFVLTDRDGVVTRWTPRAEALFGWEATTAIGRALLDTLVAAESSTPVAGRLETSVRHRDGREFPVEFTFIPVPMSHSLEFNGFLESLESKRPREAVMRRVQSQYSDVLDWIGSVVDDGGVPLHSDEMTAGTIVSFLPQVEAPWSEPGAEPDAEANGAAPAAGNGAALAQVFDRAAEALARSDALERTLGEATSAVDEARARADEAHEQGVAAAARVTELGNENASLRGDLDQARAELAELRQDLDARPAAAIDEDALEELRSRVEGARTETAEALRRMEEARSEPSADAGELERLKDETARLRGEVTALREAKTASSTEDIERLREEVGGADAASAADRAETALAAVRDLAESLKAETEAVRAEAERAAAGARAAGVEAKVARVQAEAARVHADESGTHARTAKEVANALAGAVEERESPTAKEPPTPGRAADRRLSRKPAPVRESREGFDDVPQPMAVIALDGHFRELNPAFSELVGYSEHDFRVASWPPVADGRQLEHHREQMAALLAGQEKKVEVSTGYVHAQGLLVPITGTLSLGRDDSGEPDHFLLEVAPPAARSA